MPRICHCGVAWALTRLRDLGVCHEALKDGIGVGARGFHFCCRPRPCGPPRSTCPSTRVSPLSLPPTIPVTQHAIARAPGCLRAMPLRFTTVPPIAVCLGVFLQLFELELACDVPLHPSSTVCFFLISTRLTLRAVALSCPSISRQLLCNQVVGASFLLWARL